VTSWIPLSYILKQQWCLSVWAVPEIKANVVSVCGDKQGRAGVGQGRAARAAAAGGRARCHFY
jgi:hypothetical protein